MSDTPDSELVLLFKEGDNKHYAFNLIIKKYQERLYWHVRRMVVDHDDANDIMQNVFIKVWNHLAGFREESQLYTWLYRIASNESMTFLRQKKTRFMLPIVDVEHELSNKLSDDEMYDGDYIQQKLQQAILTLPARQREVFNLKYYENMKYEDMAEMLGLTMGALKASYHHAVKKIEKFISNI